jgi:hypothetical protein
MRRDIEEVNNACWHHKLLKTYPVEKSDELSSCDWEEVAASTDKNIPFMHKEFIPASISKAAGAAKKRRRERPMLQLLFAPDVSNLDARCDSEPPVTSPISPEATSLTSKRASLGIIFNSSVPKAIREPLSTLPPRSPDVLRLSSSSTDQKLGHNSQRRASLGARLLKKFQHS